MEQLEFQCPTTAAAFWLMNLFATDTACLGCAWSSPERRMIFFPRTPPFSFHSLTASSAAFFRSTPILLWAPVMGPAAPILMTFSSLRTQPRADNSKIDTIVINCLMYVSSSRSVIPERLYRGPGVL